MDLKILVLYDCLEIIKLMFFVFVTKGYKSANISELLKVNVTELGFGTKKKKKKKQKKKKKKTLFNFG